MHRLDIAIQRLGLALAVLVLAPLPGLAQATKPTKVKITPATNTAPKPLALPPDVLAGKIDEALVRSVAWLRTQVQPNGSFDPAGDAAPANRQREALVNQDATGWRPINRGGRTALAVLAMLSAGVSPQDEQLSQAITYLRELDMAGPYAIAVRVLALSRLADDASQTRLDADIALLLAARNRAGRWSYGGVMDAARDLGDNSITQLVVLALSEAQNSGAAVPNMVWEDLEKYWRSLQNPDGGWSYAKLGAPSYGSMTAAGLVSLWLCMDHGTARSPFPSRTRPVQSPPLDFKALRTGQAWLTQHFQTHDHPGLPGQYFTYYLFALARVGTVAGQRYFGRTDWYAPAVSALLARQNADGSFVGGDPLVETAWATLFLAKAKAPLIINKLALGEDWDRQPFDAAHLAVYLGRTYEREFAWQVLAPEAPLEQFLEAPILYLTGQKPFTATPEQVDKLRAYLDRGGVLFADGFGARQEWTESFKTMMKQVWPGRDAQPLPADHPLYSAQFQLARRGTPPALLGWGDQYRTQVFLSGNCSSTIWHHFLDVQYPADFELMANVLRYAAELDALKTRQVISLTPRRIVTQRVRVARLQLGSELPPSPFMVMSLDLYLRNNYDVGLQDVGPIPLDKADAAGLAKAQVLLLTAPDHPTLSEPAKALLRQYVAGGGTVLIDAYYGNQTMAVDLAGFLTETFGQAPVRVAADDALFGTQIGRFTVPALKNIRYRQALQLRNLPDTPTLLGIKQSGRWAVLASPLDLTTGVAGHSAFGCRGYLPEDALRIAAAVVLSAAGSPGGK